MRGYTRGQETFVNRIVVTVKNLVLLAFMSVFSGFLFSLAILYFKLPEKFWFYQQRVHEDISMVYQRRGPFEVIPYWIYSTYNVCAHYSEIILKELKFGLESSPFFFIAAMLYFSYRGRRMEEATFLRGSKVISAKAFNRQFKNDLRDHVKNIRRSNPFNFKLLFKTNVKNLWGKPFKIGKDNINIPSYALSRHMALLGATGVGKTTLINSYIKHSRARGDKGIILDLNGEYAKRFYQKQDVVLSLTDKNASFWDFSSEPIAREQFANFLVPSGSDANAFWWKGARSVLAQLLSQAPSGAKLWEMVNSPGKDLSSFLDGFAKKLSGAEGSAQASGISASTILDLSFLKSLNYWPKALGKTSPFSVYRWAQDQSSRWIFVTFSDSDKALMNPLIRLWLNLAVLGLLERKDPSVPSLNFVIDELASIGKIELLPTAIERARKYGGKVILGYQADSQLKAVYGKDAESIKANTGTKFVFRSPSANEAKDLSDYLGRVELVQPNLSTSFGPSPMSDRESIGDHVTIKNIVLDSEIRALPDYHFYMRSLHLNPVKSALKGKLWAENCYTPQFSKACLSEIKTKQEDKKPGSSKRDWQKEFDINLSA